MNLVEYADREMMMIELANKLAGQIAAAVRSNEEALFVVPGGGTPGPIFDTLCGVDLKWDRVRVMLSDERWVPETSDRSNTRLLRERLLVDRAAAATYLPLYADAETPEERLEELTAAITPHLPITVLLLGMGTDMHTASLFPGADRLAEAMADNAPILVPMRAPGAPEPRVTLSAPVLAGAIHKHIVITGKDKRDALRTARNLGDPMQAPVAAVLGGATVHWAE
ncbi:MAG: 6-phosphogluconolactonase [Paracoccaceae bacterium]